MSTREEIRNSIQGKTFEDLKSKLDKFGICNLVRPVGFGKTYLLSKLAEDKKYKTIVYFYPNTTVRMQSIGESCSRDIFYVSYNMLARYVGRIYSGEFLEKVVGSYVYRDILFIFDESHFVGGERTSKAFKELYDTYRDGNYFVGSTATSIRSNNIDVSTEYFRGKQTFYYDTNLGMKDGLYYPIVCTYCNFNVGSLVENKLTSNLEYSKMPEDKKFKYKNFIRNKMMRVSKIENAYLVYKDTIEDVIPEEHRGYMRFIVFVASYSIMDFQKMYLYEDFKKAFPDKEINIIEVRTPEDVAKLSNLKEKDGMVDLIMSVDLLQHGYHDNKLSGVIMLRSTSSEKVYSQSTLRGLSVVNNHSTLVLDMLGSHSRVKNLEFKPYATPEYKFRNSGGKGNLDKKYIEVRSINSSIESIYDLTQIDRLKRALKVNVLVEKGVMPLDVACRELSLKDESLYTDFINLASEAFNYFN